MRPVKIIFLVFLFFLSGCFSNSTIDGIWISDKNNTVSYLKGHARLTDSEYAFMEKNLGHTYFIFKEGVFCRFVDGYSDGVRYNPPVHSSSRFLVRKYQDSFHVVEVVSDMGVIQYAFPLFFTGNDAFWVLTGWDEKFVGGREYFAKVPESVFREKRHGVEIACK